MKAARYGLNVSDINTVVQAATGGAVATTLLEADRQFNVTVRAKPEYRNSIEAIRNIKVGYQTPAGNAYIPLSELASITLDTGSSYIYHERNQRYVPIKFSVRGRDLAGAVAEAQQRIAQNVTLPVGYRIQWAGEFEGMQQAQKRLALIVPVALVLILVLLYSLFNSLRDSLMALLGIPFSVAGGLIALYVSDLNFSISAAIGFVSLFGVSVMSGILIISAYHRVYSNSMSTVDAMFEAASQQMRPIMMMALSACIGLFPAAISTGIGSQVQRPLATVVVGGMLVGPILLLIIVPAVMSMILDWRRRAAAPRERRRTGPRFDLKPARPYGRHCGERLEQIPIDGSVRSPSSQRRRARVLAQQASSITAAKPKPFVAPQSSAMVAHPTALRRLPSWRRRGMRSACRLRAPLPTTSGRRMVPARADPTSMLRNRRAPGAPRLAFGRSARSGDPAHGQRYAERLADGTSRRPAQPCSAGA